MVQDADRAGQRLSIFADIGVERERQEQKFGATESNPDAVWLAVLIEEVGEVGRALLDARRSLGPYSHLRKELVQVAAVAVAWLESIDSQVVRS
jgi:NTP pyrophosphatase (non-canonical NTP hydrolase)